MHNFDNYQWEDTYKKLPDDDLEAWLPYVPFDNRTTFRMFFNHSGSCREAFEMLYQELRKE